jgi:maltose/moltooligosaccharide transporter
MFFASVGAVVGSLLPWMMTRLGVASSAPPGEISDAVKCGFYLGAALLLSAVCWSAFKTHEYPPEALARFDAAAPEPVVRESPLNMRRHALVWLVLGAVGIAIAHGTQARLAFYVLAILCELYGAFLLVASRIRRENAFTSIVNDLESMSGSMRWLAIVQFCSWFSLFAIFVYTTPAVAKLHFGATQPGSPGYEAGANWVGVLFATYNGLGAVTALIIPWFVKRLGIRRAHQLNLVVGRVRIALDAADPRSRLAAGLDGRARLRVGIHRRAALRDAGQQPAVAEDGREHGHLQHLHRDPAAAGRDRASAGCWT